MEQFHIQKMGQEPKVNNAVNVLYWYSYVN